MESSSKAICIWSQDDLARLVVENPELSGWTGVGQQGCREGANSHGVRKEKSQNLATHGHVLGGRMVMLGE